MRKKSGKKGIGLIAFISFTLVVVSLFGAHRFYGAYRAREWRGESVFVVFNSRDLTIEVYEPLSEKIATYLLPQKSYVEVPSGYGFYKIEDVVELSVVEGKGETILTQTISNAFGIPFDATTKTLNDWDRLAILYARALYEHTDTVVDLSSAPIFATETRVDGETMEKVDYQKADHFFKHDLWDKAITDENLSVGIFNASKEANIALILSRKLEKIGVHVTEIDNLFEEVNAPCEMRVKEDKKSSYTTKRLARLFGCVISNTPPNPRFDIMVITAR